MRVDQQLTLLRMSARVDPHLRQAVADVEARIEALERAIEREVADHECYTLPWRKQCLLCAVLNTTEARDE